MDKDETVCGDSSLPEILFNAYWWRFTTELKMWVVSKEWVRKKLIEKEESSFYSVHTTYHFTH